MLAQLEAGALQVSVIFPAVSAEAVAVGAETGSGADAVISAVAAAL